MIVKKNMFYIYKITNTLNNKSYIGLTTKSIEERWKQHCRGNKWPIDLAIRKYGKNNFTVEEIDHTDDFDELNQLEIEYVSKFDTISPNGYNISAGGGQPSPHTVSPESNLKRRTAMLANWENGIVTGFSGYHHSDDSKKLISAHNGNSNGRYVLTDKRSKHLSDLKLSNTGRIQSDEERAKRSKAQRLAYSLGRHKPVRSGGRPPMSDEEKIRNSESQIGKRYMHNDHIKVNVVVYRDEIEKMIDNGWKLEKNPLYNTIKRKEAKLKGLI